MQHFLMQPSLLFLPGAGGSAAFWRPAFARMSLERPARFLSWPGLGAEPPDPAVRGLDDLVSLTLTHLGESGDIVAQSMGGVVAIKAALAARGQGRQVRRLVLTAVSGGLSLPGAMDWRADYFAAFPGAARWIAEPAEDLSPHLGRLAVPTLLIWGDCDPISPVPVGERLQALLPDARLRVVAGGGHDLAVTHAAEVAALIRAHLA
jgi:pimeloyl-ACP methyl ester carboxylesterase